MQLGCFLASFSSSLHTHARTLRNIRKLSGVFTLPDGSRCLANLTVPLFSFFSSFPSPILPCGGNGDWQEGLLKIPEGGSFVAKYFFFFGGGYEERISLRDCGAARIVNRILNTETNLKINSNILKRAHLRYYSRLAMKIYSKRNLTVRISIKDYRARAMDKWWGRRRP